MDSSQKELRSSAILNLHPSYFPEEPEEGSLSRRRSSSCIELDTLVTRVINEEVEIPPIPIPRSRSRSPSFSVPRPKSDIFLEIGSVFAKNRSKKPRDKDLKLNLSLVKGSRSSKSTADLVTSVNSSLGLGQSRTVGASTPDIIPFHRSYNLSEAEESQRINDPLRRSSLRQPSVSTTTSSASTPATPYRHERRVLEDSIAARCSVNHAAEGKQSLNAVFPCNIDTLYNWLFTKSKFDEEFNAARKTTNVCHGQWEDGPNAKRTRTVTMTVSTNQRIGPKHANLTVVQVMTISKPGACYVVDGESTNAGVPYADSMMVKTHNCLSAVSVNECKLVVVSQIIFTKPLFGFTKSMIEKNASSGLDDHYTHLEKALKEQCSKEISSIRNENRLRSVSHDNSVIISHSRRRAVSPRLKGKAPEAPVRTSISNCGQSEEKVKRRWFTFQLHGELSIKILYGLILTLLVFNVFLYVKLYNLEHSVTECQGRGPLSVSEEQERHCSGELCGFPVNKWDSVLGNMLAVLEKAHLDLEELKGQVKECNSTCI